MSLSKLIATLTMMATTSHGFAIQPGKPIPSTVLQASSLSNVPTMYDTPSDCYIIYPEEDADPDEVPRFVCTNTPGEYAWFNGVDEDAMIPTGSTDLDAFECQETESFRGVPEWECKMSP